ncbi:MAG: CBS domain-containing protein [Pseudomonadota bacterium]
MTVKAILREKGSKVFTMTPTATLAEVAKELSERRIGAVLLMQGETLKGIISERDIVRAVAQTGPSALDDAAEASMTKRVETCGLDDPIDTVMGRMTQSRFRHMPVVEEGRLIGLVSIGDVVKRRIQEAVQESEELRAYIHAI